MAAFMLITIGLIGTSQPDRLLYQLLADLLRTFINMIVYAPLEVRASICHYSGEGILYYLNIENVNK